MPKTNKLTKKDSGLVDYLITMTNHPNNYDMTNDDVIDFIADFANCTRENAEEIYKERMKERDSVSSGYPLLMSRQRRLISKLKAENELLKKRLEIAAWNSRLTRKPHANGAEEMAARDSEATSKKSKSKAPANKAAR